MSGNRWDVMSIREYESQGQTKTSWTKCGAGFTNQNGSINIILELIPVAVNGEVKLQLQVPISKEEWEKRRQEGGGGQQQQGGHYPSNDGNRGARPPPGQGFGNRKQAAGGNAQRYGNRGPSGPQAQQFGPGPAPAYPENPAGYDENAPPGDDDGLPF